MCVSLGLISTVKAEGASYVSPHLWQLGQILGLASQMLFPRTLNLKGSDIKKRTAEKSLAGKIWGMMPYRR